MLKDGGGGVLMFQNALMCPKEEGDKGMAHVASLNGEGEGIGFPMCAMRLRERGRAQGATLKAEASWL